MTTYALNGLGRIGKLALRPLLERGAKIAWINDAVGDPAMHAHLLEFDTVHGRWPAQFSADDDSLTIDGTRLPVHGLRDLGALPLDGVDVVIDCTGAFKSEAALAPYFAAGVKKVVVSAPVKDGPTANIVYGVNHDIYDPAQHQIVTAASCTTNCLAPVAKVIQEHFGFAEGLMTTVHASTATQSTVDSPNRKDLRSGRGAAQNIIPASTGAAKAVTLVLPELTGKLTGMALRVPTPDVSVVDLTVRTEKATNYREICDAMKAASTNGLRGVLGYTEDPVVSTDFVGDPRSSIFDAGAGIELNPNFFKLLTWYDNEWGYSNRVVDLMMHMALTEGLLQGVTSDALEAVYA